MYVVEHKRQVTDAQVGTNRPSFLQRQKQGRGGGPRHLMNLRHMRQESALRGSSVSPSRQRPVQQRFDLAFEHDSGCGVVHLGPEDDAPLRVDQRVGRRALHVIVLLGPFPLALERHEADAHRGKQRQDGLALRRFEVDCEHREAAVFVLLENLLQVGKLPTAGGSTREPEGEQHHAAAIVGELHGFAVPGARELEWRGGGCLRVADSPEVGVYLLR
jgi:hypothetical protein